MSRAEWLRDLASAECELGEAKTVQKVRAIQIQIRQIKHYLTCCEVKKNESSFDSDGW